MLSIIVITVLIVLSALFSGLTLGLMSLNTFALRRKARLGSIAAKKVLPLREKGNLLLCTLLLGNVAVNAALSIFLGSLTAGVFAGLIATGLIVIFGEIFPQAIFARHGLKYGSYFTWLVWAFMVLLYPVTKPISLFLDKMLGGETPTAYSKREMALIIQEQHKLNESEIEKTDYELIKNSLDFSERTVRAVMTPLENAYFLNVERVLDERTIKEIRNEAHSRIPVFNKRKQEIVGILFAKDLIGISHRAKTPVKTLMRKQVKFVQASKKLNEVLGMFQEWRTHLFVVRDSTEKIVGIVTLEDVLEEIIGEIVDEHDWCIDMREPGEEL